MKSVQPIEEKADTKITPEDVIDNFLVEWVHSKWNSILSELVAMNRIVEASRDYDLLSIKQ